MSAPAAYYNEIDPYAAQWIRNLIAAGHIAPGEVDERSIEDVHPLDLRGFRQCHFFAGIGVWSYALRRAGWPDDRPVWTGSCPCQPFSAAGEGLGFTDERHLWPHFHWLISERRPPVVYGEQVSNGGAEWFCAIRDDLEAEAYAVGCADLDAASVDFQARVRLYFVAHAHEGGRQRPGLPRQAGPLLVGVAGTDRVRPHTCWTCVDGERRGHEPGVRPLAPRTSTGLEQVRAYGNALNAEAARVFIEATM